MKRLIFGSVICGFFHAACSLSQPNGSALNNSNNNAPIDNKVLLVETNANVDTQIAPSADTL